MTHRKTQGAGVIQQRTNYEHLAYVLAVRMQMRDNLFNHVAHVRQEKQNDH